MTAPLTAISSDNPYLFALQADGPTAQRSGPAYLRAYGPFRLPPMGDAAFLKAPTQSYEKHSRAFIHIFLNAAIACILYTRRLINWNSPCYLPRNVAQLVPGLGNGVQDVHAFFCSSSCHPRDNSSESQEFKVLQKGGHRCADSLLELLASSRCDKFRGSELTFAYSQTESWMLGTETI